MAFWPKIAADANAWLHAVKYLEAMSEKLGKVQFVVPKTVKQELKTLEKRNQKLKKKARVALLLQQKWNAKIVDTQTKNADDALLELSKKNWIFTLDKKLQQKIKKRKGHLILIEQNQTKMIKE